MIEALANKQKWQKQLLQKAETFHRLETSIIIKISNQEATVYPGVHRPDIQSLADFQVENIPVNASDRVLEIGCGSGAVTMILSQECQHVTAIDISPVAVSNTKFNCRNSTNVSVFQSDLFSKVPADQKFDIIIFNAPFFRIAPGDILHYAWCYHDNLFERFFEGSRSRLKTGGHIYLVYSSVGYLEDVLRPAELMGFNFKVIAATCAHLTIDIDEYYLLFDFTDCDD